jgi:Na+-driven multidrug efflux pump
MNFINIILSFILIIRKLGIPPLGIKGAAIATVFPKVNTHKFKKYVDTINMV